MKISVAMTTYNGEHYIISQLLSLYNQTRQPDEVIISDDKSNDNTVNLIKDFIEKNAIDNWIIIENEINKGWERNFVDTIALTTGDYIFCADQDDIWLSDKIEKMVDIMEINDKIMCLASGFNKIDGGDIEIFEKKEYSNEIKYLPFSKKVNELVLLGCTMAFRKDIKYYLECIENNDFSHDSQICRISCILDGMYIYDTPLIKYRIHSSNTSGIQGGNTLGVSTLSKKIEYTKKNIYWLESIYKELSKKNPIMNDEKKLKVLNRIIIMQQTRLKFYSTRSIILFIKLLRYLSYYNNIITYFGDFCYTYNLNAILRKYIFIKLK